MLDMVLSKSCINSFNSHTNPIKKVLLLSSCYQWENLSSRQVKLLPQGHKASLSTLFRPSPSFWLSLCFFVAVTGILLSKERCPLCAPKHKHRKINLQDPESQRRDLFHMAARASVAHLTWALITPGHHGTITPNCPRLSPFHCSPMNDMISQPWLYIRIAWGACEPTDTQNKSLTE